MVSEITLQGREGKSHVSGLFASPYICMRQIRQYHICSSPFWFGIESREGQEWKTVHC